MVIFKKRLLYTLATVSIVLCIHIPYISAANWPLAPYFVFQGAALSKIAWKESFEKGKFSMPEAAAFVGPGVLFNPAKLDSWLFSVEVLYHIHTALASRAVKGHGPCIVGKWTFPVAAGIENVFGFGPSALWTKDTTPPKPFTYRTAIMVYGGRNWHMRNGYYFTLRGIYLIPFEQKDSKHSVSLAFGMQWNLV
jgi:hypothetical protein